ncbi:MAG: crossover junction endodeoxyribonuclease RuvC [Bacteriovoracia bacterium]
MTERTRVTRVLGIDPGSRLLGYGLVEKQDNQLRCLAHGTLKFDTAAQHNDRLLEIHQKVSALLFDLSSSSAPFHGAIEKVFFAKNVQSALKLGAARGIVLLSLQQAQVPIFEYNPTEIKQAIVGHGHASKEDVARMVSRVLSIKEKFATLDASDALAIAICHLHTYFFKQHVGLSSRQNSLKR